MTKSEGYTEGKELDSGLRALVGIAGYYRIIADPQQLERDLALTCRASTEADLVHAAKQIGLRARIVKSPTVRRLASVPVPAIVKIRDGNFQVFGGKVADKGYRLVDPISRIDSLLELEDLGSRIEPFVVLVARMRGGAGIDPRAFGFSWFLPTMWRYRRPISNVLIASLFVQIFALVTPLFFQVIVDKVLPHKGFSTLYVMVGGLALLGIFDVVLQYLRSYILSHTTNRIDVELGRRLFRHLLRLPLGYFETRSAGQTVARVRELETIRGFLTGTALFSVLDLLFAFIFVAVLLAYSWPLTLIVLGSIPCYILIATLVRPPLRSRVKDRFNKGAESQQFLVEAVLGAHTVKAAASEPIMQDQWEERLAAYVRTSFLATLLGSAGQNAIQYVNKLTTALLVLFGAKAAMDGDLSIGQLIAFNMIAGQVAAPILRLSQVWQDFQQVQISVERLGDILNTPAEPTFAAGAVLPPPRGAIKIQNVSFRYRPASSLVLKEINLSIEAGETIGIVGPSGSGKSTLSKLLQRFYLPEEGQILLDGTDLTHCDVGWLRSHTSVVLQENFLFNRTVHENIAFAAPSITRAHVMAVAKMAGADEFIAKMPMGFDTLIEERGCNLSGGQRQRLAIARALATNPRILIFDEATSALDYASEAIIHQNMRQIALNRTVIIIAHRLNAVRHCHRIVSLAEGRVVEIGTHDELLREPGGLYANLWKLQQTGVPA